MRSVCLPHHATRCPGVWHRDISSESAGHWSRTRMLLRITPAIRMRDWRAAIPAASSAPVPVSILASRYWPGENRNAPVAVVRRHPRAGRLAERCARRVADHGCAGQARSINPAPDRRCHRRRMGWILLPARRASAVECGIPPVPNPVALRQPVPQMLRFHTDASRVRTADAPRRCKCLSATAGR